MITLHDFFAPFASLTGLQALGKSLLSLAITFATRHWLLAVVNSAATALLGVGLLRLLPKFSPASTRRGGLRTLLFRDRDLRLRRLLFVAVLCKGAFYLILGDAHRPTHHYLTPACGFQIPDPLEVLRMIPQTPNTIWRPTDVTGLVGPLLAGAAFVLLLQRARQIGSLMSQLETLATNSGADARLQDALARAGETLGFRPEARLPQILLAEVPVATPMLVGLTRPYILIAPSLAALLSEAELEAALRHELAHFRRRDNWWRWLLLWIGDIGRLNPLSGWLEQRALDAEEGLCDRWAVTSPRSAAALAHALIKSQAHGASLAAPAAGARLTGANSSLVLPRLQGSVRPIRASALERRIEGLLEIAKASTTQPLGVGRDTRNSEQAPSHVQTKLFPRIATLLRGGWTLIVIVLLLAVIYTKFFILITLW